jgi:hypothetical protein
MRKYLIILCLLITSCSPYKCINVVNYFDNKTEVYYTEDFDIDIFRIFCVDKKRELELYRNLKYTIYVFNNKEMASDFVKHHIETDIPNYMKEYIVAYYIYYDNSGYSSITYFDTNMLHGKENIIEFY